MKDLPTIYFPVFWFSLRAGIPDEMANSVKMLTMAPNIIHYSALGTLLIGSLLILSTAIMCYYYKGKSHSSVGYFVFYF